MDVINTNFNPEKGKIMKSSIAISLLMIIMLVSCEPNLPAIDNTNQASETTVPSQTVETLPTSTVWPTKTSLPNQTASPEPTKTPLPTDIPTPIPIDAARYENWWTYTNIALGFSFRLPSDWIVIETTTGDPLMNGQLPDRAPQRF